MLARIAQELFWLGRDLTRAEHTARMLDAAFHADVAGRSDGIALTWEGVLAVIGAKAPAPAAPGETEEEGSEAIVPSPPLVFLGRAQVAPLLTLDRDSPASVVSCVDRARERGRTLRDTISTEMWESLNSFYLALSRYDLESALATGPYSLYQDVKERCALFWGLLDRTMLQDEGRAFLEAGGLIEDADMVLRMLRVAVPDSSLEEEPEGDAGHASEALAVLQAVGGFQAFRRSVRQAPDLRRVLRFLLFERAYPGSIAASLGRLEMALSAADAAPRSSPPVLRLGRLIADLELQNRAPAARGGLDELLAGVQSELELIDHDIDERYFAVAALGVVHI
jgi:uncharacterized alpha-E superfamily protein